MIDIPSLQNSIVKFIKSKKPTSYAVKIVKSKHHQFRFYNNNPAAAKFWDELEISIFFEREKRLVGSTLYVSQEARIEEILAKLDAFSKIISPKEDFVGLAKGPFEYKPFANNFDKKMEDLSEIGPEIVHTAITKAIESGARRVAGVLKGEIEEIYLVTSNDVNASDKNSRVYLHLRAFTGDEATGMGSTAGRFVEHLEVEKIAEEAGEKAKISERPITIDSGKYDVILSRPALGNLLGYAGISASAFSVELGYSFFIDKLDKRVGSDLVTLYDDGRAIDGMNSRLFDDEGVPTQKTVIIDHGVVKSFLHNTTTAVKFDTETTGNAGIIQPMPWNIILAPGDFTEEELLSEIKYGIYIENATYTRFQNIAKGDFSSILRDGIFLIENGELTKAIKGARLSDNMLNIFKNVDGVGKDLKQVYHWWMQVPVYAPKIRARNIGISRSTL